MSATNNEARTTETQSDGRFGLCPVCHKEDGYINIGRGHWLFCKQHRVCWFIGSNLFSSWKHETEAEQRRVFDELGFESFERVEPFRPPQESEEAR